jgi:hypothetical protein
VIDGLKELPREARRLSSKIAHRLPLVWTASRLISVRLRAKSRPEAVSGLSWGRLAGQWGVRMLVFGSIVLLVCVAASLRVLALAFDE